MIDQAESDSEQAGDWIGLRIDRTHARPCGHRGIVGERYGDDRVRRRSPQDLGRNVKPRVAPILSGDGEDRLSCLHHLARFGRSSGNRPSDVGLELGEAQPVLRDVHLRGRVVDPRLRRLQGLLRRIEDRPRGEASLHQVVLAIEIVLRLDYLTARGVERRLRRAHAIELVLRIELRQHLIGLDLVADAALPLDDPSADAKGEVHLVFGADVPGELDRLADLALLNGDGAHRAGLGRFGLGLLIAASRKQAERENVDKRANASARWRMSGEWSQGESSHGRRARAYRAAVEGATIRETRRSAPSPRMRSAMATAASAPMPSTTAVASSTAPMAATVDTPVNVSIHMHVPIDMDLSIHVNVPVDVDVPVVPAVPTGAAAPADPTIPRESASVPARASPG